MFIGESKTILFPSSSRVVAREMFINHSSREGNITAALDDRKVSPSSSKSSRYFP